MGAVSQIITHHAVWARMEALGATVDDVLSRGSSLSADSAEGLVKIMQALTYTGKRLAVTDPLLIPLSTLDLIDTKIAEINSYLQAFITNNDESYVITAISLVDALLLDVAKLLTPLPSEDLTIINESLGRYRNNIEELTKEYSELYKQNTSKILELEQAIFVHEQRLVEEQSKLASLSNEQQSQFSTMQDTRASDFSTALSSFRTEFVNTQLESQEKTSVQFNEFDKKLNQLHSRMINQQEKASKLYKDDLLNLRRVYADSAEKMLEEIQTHRDDVEELVGIIGNLGVTSGYLTEANVARRRLYIWQGLTVIALAGLVWVAYLMAFPTVTESLLEQTKSVINVQFIFYQTLAARIFLSITFGIFAAYSARQAEKYMDMDRRNRKLALELAAVGPYIASLPDDMQDKFKLELGEKSFGVTEHVVHSPKDPVTFWDVVKSKEFEEFFEKIMKRVRGAEN